MTPVQTAQTIVILLLNYKAAEKTLAALASLEKLTAPPDNVRVEVVAIDNASGDDSVSRLKAFKTDKWAYSVFENADNLGYSGGHNPVLMDILANRPDVSAVWLLNNDSTVSENALNALLAAAYRYPRSLVASVLRYPDGRFQRAATSLNFLRTKTRDLSESEIRPQKTVDAVSGASWFIPRQALIEVGLLDERYFLYFEDTAYCFAARKAGWTCRVALESVVFHEESATTSRYPALMRYYYQRNRLLFLREVLPGWQWLWVNFYTQLRMGREAKLGPKLQRAFELAYTDFKAERFGPCQHSELF